MVGIVCGVALWRKLPVVQLSDINLRNPFELKSALLFGLIFAVVLFIAKYSQVHLGNNGSYLLGAIAGLANIDAITITMAQLSASGDIPNSAAGAAIIIALISNTVVKILIAIIVGTKALHTFAAKGLSLILFVCALTLVMLLIF
jgi:uncharacterized membrane protein (DUF4010 family)